MKGIFLNGEEVKKERKKDNKRKLSKTKLFLPEHP